MPAQLHSLDPSALRIRSVTDNICGSFAARQVGFRREASLRRCRRRKARPPGLHWRDVTMTLAKGVAHPTDHRRKPGIVELAVDDEAGCSSRSYTVPHSAATRGCRVAGYARMRMRRCLCLVLDKLRWLRGGFSRVRLVFAGLAAGVARISHEILVSLNARRAQHTNSKKPCKTVTLCIFIGPDTGAFGRVLRGCGTVPQFRARLEWMSGPQKASPL